MAKASGPSRRRPAWVGPAACLAFIVVGAAVAVVVLNTPSRKALEIDVACQAFHSPVELVLPISAERLRRVHLRGYDGRLERLTRVNVEGVSGGGADVTFTIQPNGGATRPLPYERLLRDLPKGQHTVKWNLKTRERSWAPPGGYVARFGATTREGHQRLAHVVVYFTIAPGSRRTAGAG